MNKSIYEWYKATKRLIREFEDNAPRTEEAREVIEGWKSSLETMEQSCPGIKERYERNLAVQESFTPEQIDFICYQIGDWYLDWKHRMATGEGTQHRLGIAKEYLKAQICGDFSYGVDKE